MIDGVQGRVVLITGGGTGIGLGIAQVLAEARARVVITGRTRATLDAAAARLTAEGHDVCAHEMDVTDRAAWRRVVRAVAADLGPVRILVNNAGVSTLGLRFDEITPQLWDDVIATNLHGVYNGVHAVLDGMRGAGGGHIVNVASMAGLMAVRRLAPYVTSKFAVVGLSEVLRLELAGDGIGVSVVCPGGVRSDLWRTSRKLRGLPDTDVPPDEVGSQSAFASTDPREVGVEVLAGILEDRLYIFTHPEYGPRVAQRGQRINDAFAAAESARRPQ